MAPICLQKNSQTRWSRLQALHDLALCFFPFLFLPVPPYPLCVGHAKWRPDPLVDSVTLPLHLSLQFVSSLPHHQTKIYYPFKLKIKCHLIYVAFPDHCPQAKWTIPCSASLAFTWWTSNISPLIFYGTIQFTSIFPCSHTTLPDSYLFPTI